MDPSAEDVGRSTSPLPPLKNPRFQHISRSAAKRESVQLLGSIKDLQAHFSRSGLVEHRPGSGAGVRSLGSVGEDEENQPPEIDGRREKERKERERRLWKEVELQRVDIEAVRKEAKGLISALRGIWGLGMLPSPSTLTSTTSLTSPTRKQQPDTRTILTTTAQTIRRTRSLTLAVSHAPQSSLGDRRVSTPTLYPPRPTKARSSFSTPSRPGSLPRAVSMGVPERKSSLAVPIQAQANQDVMSELRKAALDVLAGLRGLEETLRKQPPPSVEADLSDSREVNIASPVGDTSQGSSSALQTDYTGSSNRPTSAASNYYSQSDYYPEDDEDYSKNWLNNPDERKHEQTWEERIISEERQYQSLDQDLNGEHTVRESVARWVSVAERIFLVGTVGEEGGVEDWAMDLWEGKALERLHAFLLARLPLDLQLSIPPPTTDNLSNLLLTLSDGYILTQAFNCAVSSSSKAWGFIPEEDIHDTRAAGAEDGKEWTFRRIANLTCWAAAVRLRYNLPIHMPSQSTSSSFLPIPAPLSANSTGSSPLSTPGTSPKPEQKSTTLSLRRGSDKAPRIEFDPLVVAKRAAGWEASLMGVIDRWIEEAAREARREG